MPVSTGELCKTGAAPQRARHLSPASASAAHMRSQCEPFQYTRWHVSQAWNARWRPRTAGGRCACTASQAWARKGVLQCRHKVKGCACGCRLKPREHFGALGASLECAHAAAMPDNAALEQVAVAREHDAALLLRQRGNLRVVGAVVVQRIETGHAQHARQAPQMSIGNEARRARRQRLRWPLIVNMARRSWRIGHNPVVLKQQPVKTA